MLLPAVLHLHNDVFTCIRLAEDVINNLPHLHLFGYPLIIHVTDIGYHSFALQQIVQELNEHVFRRLSTENMFESPIGEGIYECSHVQLYS